MTSKDPQTENSAGSDGVVLFCFGCFLFVFGQSQQGLREEIQSLGNYAEQHTLLSSGSVVGATKGLS